MKTTADATISVDQLTAKFKTWQLYTHYSNTYARARIVYDLSHRVDGPLQIKSLDNQLASRLLTTCSRVVIIKPEQAMPNVSH